MMEGNHSHLEHFVVVAKVCQWKCSMDGQEQKLGLQPLAVQTKIVTATINMVPSVYSILRYHLASSTYQTYQCKHNVVAPVLQEKDGDKVTSINVPTTVCAGYSSEMQVKDQSRSRPCIIFHLVTEIAVVDHTVIVCNLKYVS